LQEHYPLAGSESKFRKSRRSRLTPDGYRICAVFLKLFEKLCAPLTSAILKAFTNDRRLANSKACPLDKLYRAVLASLDQLVDAVGLKVA
jgi:hypothetical protein